MTDQAAAVPVAKTVVVSDSDGVLRSYPERDVAQAVAAGGEIATPEELRSHDLQQKFGGTGGALAAAGLGAADALTFGLAGGVATAATGAFSGVRNKRRVAEALQGYEEANPAPYFVGQVGGMVAPALASGGASLLAEGGTAARGLGGAARIAGAIPRGVSALGGLAERGAAELVGTGATSLAGRVAQRAIPATVGAAVEGAAWGAGHEISDAIIKDHDLTAEQLLASAGHDALWFGLLGGGLSAGAQLGKEAASGLGNAVARRLEGSTFAEYLDRSSGEQAYRAAGGTKKMTEASDTFFKGGHAEEGKIWRNQAPELVGKTDFAQLTREELQAAAGKGLERDGQRIGDVLDQVDARAAAAGRLPRAVDVSEDIRGVIARVQEHAGAGPVAAKLESFAKDVDRITGVIDATGELVPGAGDRTISITDLRNFRKDADNIWAGSKANPELFGFRKEFKEVRDVLEKRVEAAVEEFGKDGLAKEYAESKRLYQAWADLAKATKSGTAAQATNQFFSLGDKVVGGAAGQIGAVVGGPVGALVGTGLGALGNHLMRARGSFVASSLLDKAARFASVERMSARVDARIGEGIKGFLDGGKVAALPEYKHDKIDYVRAAAAVHDMQQNPQKAVDHLERSLVGIGQHLPTVATAITGKASAGLAYLAAHAPIPYSNTPSLTPQFERVRIDETKLRDFAERLTGTLHPLSIFSDMKAGRLTHAKADAVRVNYPEIFAKIQKRIIDDVAKAKKLLPYEKRQQLSNMFGVPLDETQTPEFTFAVQATKTPPQPPQAQGGPQKQGGSKRPLKLDSDAYNPNPTRT